MNNGQPYFEIGERAEIDPGVTLGYRFSGCSRPTILGSDAVIRSGSIIYANTSIGDHFSCGHGVIIRAETIIGNRVVVLHRTTLEGNIRIGDGVKIMAHVYIPSATEIGSLVFIGPGTTFLNDRYPMRKVDKVRGPVIEDHAVIGGGVTISAGVRIGRNSFVGAGAVVVNDVPANMLAYGSPARCRPLPELLAGGNNPELMLTKPDLWGDASDDSWKAAYDHMTVDQV